MVEVKRNIENLPLTILQTKYLKFVLVKYKIKTKVYAVVSVSDDQELGRIEWSSKWKEYCFTSLGITVWKLRFLEEIQNFIKLLMSPLYNNLKVIAVISKNFEDFQYWSQQKKHRKKIGHKFNRYISGNSEYIAITTEKNFHGFKFNKIVETDNAYLNPKYNEIKHKIKFTLI